MDGDRTMTVTRQRDGTIAHWGDHFEVDKALAGDSYVDAQHHRMDTSPLNGRGAFVEANQA
jgi:hypothetical protein